MYRAKSEAAAHLIAGIFGFALGLAGYVLVFKYLGWQVTLALFLMQWGNNIGLSILLERTAKKANEH